MGARRWLTLADVGASHTLSPLSCSQKRKPDDAWGLPWGQPTAACKRAKDDELSAAGVSGGGRGAAGAGGDEDRQQQLLNERRARNRRHARETRRRKKESLHDMLAELEALRLLQARHEGSLEAARDLRACRRLTHGLELVLALRAQGGTAAAAAQWQAAVAPGAVLVAPLAPYRFSAPPTTRAAAAPPGHAGHCVSPPNAGTSSAHGGQGAGTLIFAAAPLDDLGLADHLGGHPHPQGDGAHAAACSAALSQAAVVSAIGVAAFMAEAAGLAVCVAKLTGRGVHEDAATQAHWQAVAHGLSDAGAAYDGLLVGEDVVADGLSLGPPPPKPPKPSGALAGGQAAKPASPPPLLAAVPASPSSVTHRLNPVSSSDEDPDGALALSAPAHALAALIPARPRLPLPPALRRSSPGVQLEHVLVGEACLGRGGTSVLAPFELRSTNLVRDFGCKREVCERGTVLAEFEPAPAHHRAAWLAPVLPALLPGQRRGGGGEDDGGGGGGELGDGAAPLQVMRLELCYDVVAFWRQLQAARGGGGLAVQPSTLADARRSVGQASTSAAAAVARAVVSATPPHAVEDANEAWRALAGGAGGTVLGRLLGRHSAAAPTLSQPLSAVEGFVADLAAGRPSSLGFALPHCGGEAATTATARVALAVVDTAPLVAGGGGTVTHFLLTLRAAAAVV